jgi:hypothetical protein
VCAGHLKIRGFLASPQPKLRKVVCFVFLTT